MDKVPMTLQKFKLLKQELKQLKTVERKRIADALSQFRNDVELSEDSAYNDTLLTQNSIEEKIAEIEDLLEHAEIIKAIKSSKVNIGSTVVIKKAGDRKEMTMKLVGAIDADPSVNFISVESPLGKALLGGKKEDIIPVITPNGNVNYKIIKVG